MAKVSARGARQICAVNAKGTIPSIFEGETIDIDRRYVLRSDGAVLVRTYKGGGYSVAGKLSPTTFAQLKERDRLEKFLSAFAERQNLIVYKIEGAK
jgi:hypothetical protein